MLDFLINILFKLIDIQNYIMTLLMNTDSPYFSEIMSNLRMI